VAHPGKEEPMTLVDRFMQYAAAFEDAYASDDFSKIEPYFTEDAVYEAIADAPLSSRTEGRATLAPFFKQLVNGFDRRFDSRTVEMIEGPVERGNTVWFRWVSTYTLGGAPPLRMEGEETATFEGDRIRRLEDRMPAATQQVMAYLGEHGGKLKPVES
jgi:ketosteroid isomerase-like protein